MFLSVYASTRFFLLIAITIITFSDQFCPEEISGSGIKVTWHRSSQASYVESDPLCFHDEKLVTRNCTNGTWTPSLHQVQPCYKAVKYFDPSSCPPGFEKISNNFNKYCYQVSEPTSWNYPCFKSGGATVITELNVNETESLLISLNATNYRYFWLPARRQSIFAPIMWSIPGPNWGRFIASNEMWPLQPALLKNCLLLDLEERVLITDTCSKEHPSLCFYINDFHYPTKCPENYHAFRYMLDDGRCYGIEKSISKMTFEDFLNNTCKQPMGNSHKNELRRFIYSKIAELSNNSNDAWCWFADSNYKHIPYDKDHQNIHGIQIDTPRNLVTVINNMGTVGLMDSSSLLPCMACEANMIYGETELDFEYCYEENKIHLTIYFPSGLWRYDNKDIGVQCFSDATGFFQVIDINDLPIDVKFMKTVRSSPTLSVEKVVYVINLVTDRSARYWCEGHTKNFSLITTPKIVVNPQGNLVHVFSLVLNAFVELNESNDKLLSMTELSDNITSIFHAEKVLVMDILDYRLGTIQVLLHLHIHINDTSKTQAKNLQKAYQSLFQIANAEFPKYNYTFVNMSSSIYCLPTTSSDTITLNWDLTPIGHFAAPQQFCLQANGLPVNRACLGSYFLGSFWGNVNGRCDSNYTPSSTTTFLFNFINGKIENNYISNFLTYGLNYVLNDVDIIIPADIYYMSLCLQYILRVTKQNITSIETGGIENIAWVMDRLMTINNARLRLAQTLNSTNAILDSMNSIVEVITNRNKTFHDSQLLQNAYQLAVQPQYIIQVSYPRFNNITGIAVIKNGDSNSFTQMYNIKPLYENTTITDVISIENLEVATWLPRNVLGNLKKSNVNNTQVFNHIRLIISVYSSDAIFQELTANKHRINSRIVEVTIPGYSTNLENAIPLIFKELIPTRFPIVCGYWDFHSEKPVQGSWSKSGCIVRSRIDNLTICECDHLTHFGQLLNIRDSEGSDEYIIEESHRKALNIITLIGSFTSLLGITGIWLTAIVFDTWRKKAGTKVLLQLSTAIALPLILIIVFNLDHSIIIERGGTHRVARDKIVICVILGALFHYSVLANFIWMLITAILQFIRYVRVLGVSRPSRFLIKLTLIGWGIPLIPVVIVLVVDYENYVPSPSRGRSICYPNGFFMYTGIILPVCIILVVNVVLFILVLKSISQSSDLRTPDKSLVYAQFRLSILLFFLLGLTWIFGIVSFSGNLVWSYLFCLTSTIQGFVLFVYFVICDPTTRSLWITVMKPQFKSSRKSVTTISSE